MGEDGATDDPSKRSRQVSSIGPFKCPLPRFQDNFAHGGADTAPPPSKPTAGLVASSRTIHPALPSREWYVSSQREAGPGALKTGAYSRFDGGMWASIGNNKGLDAEISPSVSPDQSLNWLSVQSNADEGSMGQAIIASGAGQGPHVAENAARHLPTIPDKTDGSDPHPMSVVTNNAQSWDPTTMIDSFPEPIGYPAPGLSSIASPATSPHPHHYPVDRDILCAQELTPSLLRFTTSQSHYQQPNVSSQLENPGASSNAQNGDYPTSREFYGASSPDYSEVPSPLWQGLNITQVSSKTTNTPQPPSGVNIMAPVREDSLDTLIRNLTAPVGAEPSSASGTSPLSENWSSITNRSGVAQHVSSSQSSPLPSGDEAGNDSIAAGTGSDEDFDEHKSMGILKLIMERAARKKGRERRERFKKKLKPGAAPNGGGASVEANHRRIAPHQPTSLQRTAQTWASPSPSITISRPESNPTEWYGHLIFDGEGLSDLEPIPVAISSPHLRYCSSLCGYSVHNSSMSSVQDLPEAIYIHASDLRRPADWTSFHMFLGAHNVAIFPLRHYLASNGPKPLSGSSTVGYEPFLNMLYDNKMVCVHDFRAYVTIADLFVPKFASIEFSDRARGTGIAIFPWMGLSGCKLQVALFDHTRPLPTMEELASYVQNMGPSMMLPSHALGIREGTVDSPHTDSTSRTAQFAREMQHKQQQQFMVGSNPSSELSPSPVPYTSPSEQLLSFDQTVFGYSNYNNSAPQLLLEPASTSPFQLAGQLDTYHANSSSNEFDLSPTTYAQSNPASPSSVQYLGAPEEYSSPGYTQIPDADHSLYNSLMFNSSPMQDNGYAPQPGTENVYYGLENGHL